MGRWIRTALRPVPRRFRYQAPHAQAERIVLSGDDRAKRRGVTRNSSILALALAQRLKHHRLQRQLNSSTLGGGHHHEDTEHIVHGIDKIEAAAGAVPAILAERPGRA